MKIKKIILFLAIAFGISWTAAAALYFAGIKYGSPLSLVVVATLYMMAPAAAALIIQRVIYKQPVKDLGLDLKAIRWKALLWLPLVQFLFCMFYIGVILLFGNVLGIEGFGFYSFEQGLLDTRMSEILEASGGSGLPQFSISPVLLLFLTILSSIFIGGIINGIFTLGEELGWRGFLFNELNHLGFWKSGLITGTIWGLWHAPLILQGHNYPEHPFSGILMMVPLSIALGYIMSWLRLKTNSVLGPTLFHGMVNASGGGLLMLCYEYSDLLGSIAGLAGFIGCALIVLLIWIFDRKTIRSAYLPEAEKESFPV
jgi:uncharacterized protein